ncbi:hypothetical protein [Brevibacillus centrosporus]|uniref:hypothetical protein n=1 Tax=Brevibacillus centrosporus TaxID=54910 RepID=UPI002E24F905|nr:hypothetical protein [Brevibacillus centrosporus]
MARLKPVPLPDFSAGLNNKDEANLIADNALADVQNAILGRGVISKRHGYVKHTPTPLANPIGAVYDFNKSDATREMLATSNLTLQKVDDAGAFSAVNTLTYLVIDDGEDAWTAANANVTVSADTTDKKAGTASAKMVVVDAAAIGLLAYEDISSTSIANTKRLQFWIKSNVNTNAGDLSFILDDNTGAASPHATFNIPSLAKDTWKFVYFNVTSAAVNILSVGIKQNIDLGAFTLWIDDVQLADVGGTFTLASDNAKMSTYKDRFLSDSVVIADGGSLKHYVGAFAEPVVAYTPTTNEQTNPGLNDLANFSAFRTLALKKDRFFGAGHPTVKNRLSFSYRDPILGYAVYDYWPAAFFIDVGDENDEIVELVPFRDQLIILSRHSLWGLLGDGMTIDDYTLNKINVPSGCVSRKSVAIVGNELFYLSDDHVYSLFSTDQNYVSASIVSQNVEATLKGISLADKKQAVGAFFDNKYFLSFPDGTTLVYDVLLRAWSKWTNVKANAFLERDGVLYFCTSTGYIYKFDETVYDDDGAAISFKMLTKRLDFGAPVQIKKLKRLWTVAKQYETLSSVYDLKVFADYLEVTNTNVTTDVSGVWDEGDWDEVDWDFKDVTKTTHRIRLKAENYQVEISNSEPGQPLSLYQIIFQFKLKKPK